VVSPTSLIRIRPVPGWIAKLNELRRPYAHTARPRPVWVAKNGLSAGMLPSSLKRSSLPNGNARFWACAPLAFSPTPT